MAYVKIVINQDGMNPKRSWDTQSPDICLVIQKNKRFENYFSKTTRKLQMKNNEEKEICNV